MRCFILFLLLPALLIPVTGRTQTAVLPGTIPLALKADSSYDYEAHTYLGIGLSGLSDNVYNGRHDTLVTPYISPALRLHSQNGLFASAAFSYSPANGHIDLYTLEAGYEKEAPDYEAGGSISKYFYNTSSTTVRSAISADANVYGEYTRWWLCPKGTLDLLFSKKQTDYAVSLGVSHPFFFEHAGLAVQPGVYAFGGTQHYYSAYFSRGKKGAVQDAAAIANAGAFRILDYELSMPLQWECGPLLLTLTPAYDIPVNPVELTLPKRMYKEQLSNIFWLQLDAVWRVKMGRKK